jgi:hypothetical protein
VSVRGWSTARTLKVLVSFASAVAVVSLLILVPAASTARTPFPLAAQTTAQLQVIVTGAGNTPAVNVSAGPQCTITQTRDNGQSCLYTVMEGQDVTLSPVDPTGFVGWSVFECPGTGACTINVDSDRTVVATFSPTTLTVIVEGALPDPQSFGRVTSLDGKRLLGPTHPDMRRHHVPSLCRGDADRRAGGRLREMEWGLPGGKRDAADVHVAAFRGRRRRREVQ